MKLERLEGSKRILSSAKKSDWICFEHDKFFYIVFGMTLDSKFDWKQMNYLWNIAPLIWKDRCAQSTICVQKMWNCDTSLHKVGPYLPLNCN